MSQLTAAAIAAGRLPGVDELGDLTGRRVLIRSDLNVPMNGDRITDDARIRASVPQIRALLDRDLTFVADPDGDPGDATLATLPAGPLRVGPTP